MKTPSLLVLAVLGSAVPALADIMVYQNTTTPTGSGFVFGGAATVGSNLATDIQINQLIMVPGSAGDSITSLSFQVANVNPSPVTARPVMYVWAADGAGGLPGTLLDTFDLPLTSFGSSATQTVTESTVGSGLTVPADMEIWAGLGFDNDNGASSITAAQLNFLGGLTYFPAAVGTAGPNAYYIGPAAPLNNPAVLAFGSTNTADYGWTVIATPEASSVILLFSAVLLSVGAIHRRRA